MSRWTRACGAAALLGLVMCAGSALAQGLAPKAGVARTDVPQIGPSVMMLGKFDWEIGEACAAPAARPCGGLRAQARARRARAADGGYRAVADPQGASPPSPTPPRSPEPLATANRGAPWSRCLDQLWRGVQRTNSSNVSGWGRGAAPPSRRPARPSPEMARAPRAHAPTTRRRQLAISAHVCPPTHPRPPSQINFVPTHHWLPPPYSRGVAAGVGSYCTMDGTSGANRCIPWRPELITQFRDSMAVCFGEALKLGLTISVRPHLVRLTAARCLPCECVTAAACVQRAACPVAATGAYRRQGQVVSAAPTAARYHRARMRYTCQTRGKRSTPPAPCPGRRMTAALRWPGATASRSTRSKSTAASGAARCWTRQCVLAWRPPGVAA